MKWLIIGAGAIGCLVGGKLALAGEEVTLAGRPHFAGIARQQGLRLTEAGQTRQVDNVHVAGSIGAAFAQSRTAFDLAVLTVKSYDTEAALAEIVAALPGGETAPPVLSLQNGIGNEEAIVARFGAERVIAGTITTPVSLLGPGAILIERPRHTIGFSPWIAPGEPALLQALQHSLLAAGFTVKRYAQAQGMKWTKLLMNMMGNATSAILDEPPAQVFGDAVMMDLEIEGWREALAVMQRSGIAAVNLGQYPFHWLAPLIRNVPKPLLRPFLRRQVTGGRDGKLPSLHIDLNAGKKQSELRWLNGAVVAQGRQVGVATPVNSAFTETLLTLMADQAQRAAWRHNHARLVEAVQQTLADGRVKNRGQPAQ